MLTAALILALAAPSAGPPGPASIPEDDNLVSELLVVARRNAPDPSPVTTECLWRELPPAEREPYAREVGRTLATLGDKPPHRPNRSLVTERGVAVALKACGAPAEEQALPFARTAVAFYALERAATDRLAAKGTTSAKLDAAWTSLSAGDRETLADQAGRLAGGSDEAPEAAARIVFGLIRRLRPLGAFNPLGYKAGSLNHLIVAHYTPRAVRHAMEKRF